VIRKDWSTKPLEFSDPLSLLENQVCFAVFHSSYPDKILCLTETYELAMYFLIVCEYHHQRVDSILKEALETRRDLCNLFSEVFDLKTRLKQEIRNAP